MRCEGGEEIVGVDLHFTVAGHAPVDRGFLGDIAIVAAGDGVGDGGVVAVVAFGDACRRRRAGEYLVVVDDGGAGRGLGDVDHDVGLGAARSGRGAGIGQGKGQRFAGFEAVVAGQSDADSGGLHTAADLDGLTRAAVVVGDGDGFGLRVELDMGKHIIADTNGDVVGFLRALRGQADAIGAAALDHVDFDDAGEVAAANDLEAERLAAAGLALDDAGGKRGNGKLGIVVPDDGVIALGEKVIAARYAGKVEAEGFVAFDKVVALDVDGNGLVVRIAGIPGDRAAGGAGKFVGGEGMNIAIAAQFGAGHCPADAGELGAVAAAAQGDAVTAGGAIATLARRQRGAGNADGGVVVKQRAGRGIGRSQGNAGTGGRGDQLDGEGLVGLHHGVGRGHHGEGRRGAVGGKRGSAAGGGEVVGVGGFSGEIELPADADGAGQITRAGERVGEGVGGVFLGGDGGRAGIEADLAVVVPDADGGAGLGGIDGAGAGVANPHQGGDELLVGFQRVVALEVDAEGLGGFIRGKHQCIGGVAGEVAVVGRVIAAAGDGPDYAGRASRVAATDDSDAEGSGLAGLTFVNRRQRGAAHGEGHVVVADGAGCCGSAAKLGAATRGKEDDLEGFVGFNNIVAGETNLDRRLYLARKHFDCAAGQAVIAAQCVLAAGEVARICLPVVKHHLPRRTDGTANEAIARDGGGEDAAVGLAAFVSHKGGTVECQRGLVIDNLPHRRTDDDPGKAVSHADVDVVTLVLLDLAVWRRGNGDGFYGLANAERHVAGRKPAAHKIVGAGIQTGVCVGVGDGGPVYGDRGSSRFGEPNFEGLRGVAAVAFDAVGGDRHDADTDAIGIDVGARGIDAENDIVGRYIADFAQLHLKAAHALGHEAGAGGEGCGCFRGTWSESDGAVAGQGEIALPGRVLASTGNVPMDAMAEVGGGTVTGQRQLVGDHAWGSINNLDFLNADFGIVAGDGAFGRCASNVDARRAAG